MRLQDLRNLLREFDKALKQQAGTCEKCGKPKGGFIPAGISKILHGRTILR